MTAKNGQGHLREMSDKPAKKKPRGKPFTGADDPRRGRGGRKANDNSITYWLKLYLGMSPSQVAESAEVFAAQLRKYKTPMPTAAVVAVNAINALMNEPDSRLLAQVLDRVDGKVAQKIEFEADVVAEIREMTPAQLQWFIEWTKQGGMQADALAWMQAAGVDAAYAGDDVQSGAKG